MMWIVTILRINERSCFEIGAFLVKSAASLEIPAENFPVLMELVIVDDEEQNQMLSLDALEEE